MNFCPDSGYEKIMRKEMMAFCGLDCESCDAYIATILNDQQMREETARKWSDLNGVTIMPEQISCAGCRAAGVKTVYCESLCSIRRCAAAKGVETCGDCPRLRLCSTIAVIIDNNAAALDNLTHNPAPT